MHAIYGCFSSERNLEIKLQKETLNKAKMPRVPVIKAVSKIYSILFQFATQCGRIITIMVIQIGGGFILFICLYYHCAGFAHIIMDTSLRLVIHFARQVMGLCFFCLNNIGQHNICQGKSNKCKGKGNSGQV